MNESKKRIVRHSAIVFLLTLLLLTFFSKTINQFLLPEVEVRRASRGYLQKETRASGEVKILHTKKIYSPGSLGIKEVHVRQGDSVSKGAILLSVDTSQAQLEIKSKEFDLLRLRNDLKDYQESFKAFDATEYENEIIQAQKAVDKEKQNLDIIRSIYSKDIQDHIDAASKRVEQAKKDLSDKEKLLEQKKLEAERAQKEYDRTVKEMMLAVRVKEMEIEQFVEHPPNVSYDEMTLLLNQLELQYQKLRNQLENYKANYTLLDITVHEGAITSAKEALAQEENNLRQVIESYEESSENRLRLFNAQSSLENAEVALTEKQEQLIKKQEAAVLEQNSFSRNLEQRKSEIQLKALELENLRKSIPVDGQITAPFEGVIKSVAVESGQISNNQQALFEILESHSELSVQWFMNPAQAELIQEGDKVSLKIEGEDNSIFESLVNEKKYSSLHGMYLFTTDISQGEYPLEEGQEVEITLLKTSEKYELIVPTRCISKENGMDYVYVLKEQQGALGLEYFVEKVNANPLESDDLNTAITGILPEDQLVVQSSKPLYHNAQVKLR